MKKIRVSMLLYRVIIIIPLVLMFAALVLAYLSNIESESSGEAPSLGTVSADVTWKMLLKDNLFFPTKELGSDYSFIKELVDKLKFDLKFDLAGVPAVAAVKVNYRVDGVLRVNYEASGNGLLLTREYPNLGEGSTELSQKSTGNVQEFELQLTPYTQFIESFQSAYRIGVKSKMDLKIIIDAVMEAGSDSIMKSMPLDLTIPLDSSVFQISGSPKDKIEFTAPNKSGEPAGGVYGATLYYLGAAVLMLLITGAVFLFFSPPVPEPELAMLKQVMNKCKSSLVIIKANPREAGLPMLPVADIDGLVKMSESTGQPVLYFNKKDDHLFLVSSDEILYSYELRTAVTTDPGHVPAQRKAAL